MYLHQCNVAPLCDVGQEVAENLLAGAGRAAILGISAAVTERLGAGLQIQSCRFDSCRPLENHGGSSSVVERPVVTREAGSSILLCHPEKVIAQWWCSARSWLNAMRVWRSGRASRFHRDHGSSTLPIRSHTTSHGPVAPTVEQHPCKMTVERSNRSWSTLRRRPPDPAGAVHRAVAGDDRPAGGASASPDSSVGRALP